MRRLRIPAQTRRAHLKQSNPHCDQVWVLNMAAVRRPGHRFADMNACATKHPGQDANLHWPDGPLKNGYGKIREHGRLRTMTPDELRRPVVEWELADVLRWRSDYGLRRPGSVAQRQRQAKRRRVVICWELKSREYREQDRADAFVKVVEASGWPAFYMTLVTMRFWGQKLRAFKRAGGQTALLAHGAPKPRSFDYFAPWIDRVWDHWRKSG